ncbi:hypothetical protein EXU30_19690 [Shewanella maritima]|uniref:Uncharacterized protein n=1 Tax=Shewanella maritima TaxID=2520507 RepID=A0A411PMC9_9GAMM|nr:hypothetical protein [Shewanella maritima]QBF84648.1 hypothetical protein EXU30_19690 [Shewanella maritima]
MTERKLLQRAQEILNHPMLDDYTGQEVRQVLHLALTMTDEQMRQYEQVEQAHQYELEQRQSHYTCRHDS